MYLRFVSPDAEEGGKKSGKLEGELHLVLFMSSSVWVSSVGAVSVAFKAFHDLLNSKKYGNRCEKLDGRCYSVRKIRCITSISSARNSSETSDTDYLRS